MLDLFHHALVRAIGVRLMVDHFWTARFLINPLKLQTVRGSPVSEIQLRDRDRLDSGVDSSCFVAFLGYLSWFPLVSIGFKVENVAAFKNDVEILTRTDPEWLAPKSPNLESEYNVVLGLLQRCRYGRHQLPDPEGNFIDVSEGK